MEQQQPENFLPRAKIEEQALDQLKNVFCKTKLLQQLHYIVCYTA